MSDDCESLDSPPGAKRARSESPTLCSSSQPSTVALFPSEVETTGTSIDSEIDNAVFPSDLESENKSSSTRSRSGSEDSPSPPPPPPAADARQRDLAQISSILVTECCERECLLHMSASDILKVRMKLKNLGLNAQRQWLTDKLHESSQLLNGKLSTKYIIAGREVCNYAWCVTLGVS